MKQQNKPNRRNFLKISAVAGASFMASVDSYMDAESKEFHKAFKKIEMIGVLTSDTVLSDR